MRGSSTIKQDGNEDKHEEDDNHEDKHEDNEDKPLSPQPSLTVLNF